MTHNGPNFALYTYGRRARFGFPPQVYRYSLYVQFRGEAYPNGAIGTEDNVEAVSQSGSPTSIRSGCSKELPFELALSCAYTITTIRKCKRVKEFFLRKVCSTEGCAQLAHAKGLCSLHYSREYEATRRVRPLTNRTTGGPNGNGEWRQCVCGCGQWLTSLDKRNRPRVSLPGHGRRGKSNTWSRKPDNQINYWSAHARARRILTVPSTCELTYIGGCSRRLDVHHVDSNPWNNAPQNLMRLCTAHHSLIERGRIDLRDPKMPPYWLCPNGRRIYAHTKQGEWILNPSRRRSSTSRGVLMTFSL